MILDDREFAALLWLAIAVLFGFTWAKFRACLAELFRMGLQPKILLPISFMFSYVAVEVWLGFRVTLWCRDLLKSTLLWIAFSGLAMLFAFDQASKDPHFFRHSAAKTIGIAALLEFYMNIAPMSLGAELFFQPFMAALVIWPAFAGRRAKKTAGALIVLTGFALFGFTAHQLYSGWSGIDKHGLLLQFLLPVWLSIGLLPFIYGLSLIANYEMAFARIDRMAESGKTSWRTKLALMARLGVRARAVHGFSWPWPERIAAASSFSAAWRVTSEYLSARRFGKASGESFTDDSLQS